MQLPLADAATEARGCDNERGEVGCFGAVAGKVQVSLSAAELCCYAKKRRQAAAKLLLADAETEARGYDDERGEAGGFGAVAGKVLQ